MHLRGFVAAEVRRGPCEFVLAELTFIVGCIYGVVGTTTVELQYLNSHMAAFLLLFSSPFPVSSTLKFLVDRHPALEACAQSVQQHPAMPRRAWSSRR